MIFPKIDGIQNEEVEFHGTDIDKIDGIGNKTVRAANGQDLTIHNKIDGTGTHKLIGFGFVDVHDKVDGTGNRWFIDCDRVSIGDRKDGMGNLYLINSPCSIAKIAGAGNIVWCGVEPMIESKGLIQLGSVVEDNSLLMHSEREGRVRLEKGDERTPYREEGELQGKLHLELGERHLGHNEEGKVHIDQGPSYSHRNNDLEQRGIDQDVGGFKVGRGALLYKKDGCNEGDISSGHHHSGPSTVIDTGKQEHRSGMRDVPFGYQKREEDTRREKGENRGQGYHDAEYTQRLSNISEIPYVYQKHEHKDEDLSYNKGNDASVCESGVCKMRLSDMQQVGSGKEHDYDSASHRDLRPIDEDDQRGERREQGDRRYGQQPGEQHVNFTDRKQHDRDPQHRGLPSEDQQHRDKDDAREGFGNEQHQKLSERKHYTEHAGEVHCGQGEKRDQGEGEGCLKNRDCEDYQDFYFDAHSDGPNRRDEGALRTKMDNDRKVTQL